ncbi:tRNA lysidine(34) synthetase TilS [Owenweeksia hongkongensis]|uniref:tRNA lysidine(34) synthetase TilS n=1 Tax=Owenweeksia hongkongensis TaxID=253245 RepID=UPI003A917180
MTFSCPRLFTFDLPMYNLPNIIPQFLKAHNIDDSSRFLIACSGGVDSMVLAELFVQAGQKPALVHCNFMLRGDDADGDQVFVENYAKDKGLTFYTKNFDTTAFAKEKGISIQMAARDLRYSYFASLLKNHHLKFLCTAHHADDSLETILLNLGRGTGLSGLSGMKPRRDNILRPLLHLTKGEIIEIAHSLQLAWREDASNTKTDYQRNYIRHKVAPVFKENFPGFDTGFKNTSKQLINDDALFNFLLNEKVQSLLIKDGNLLKMPIAELLKIKGYPSFLHYWLKPYGNFDLPSIIESLNGKSGRVFVSGQHELLVDRDFLILRQAKQEKNHTYFINEGDEILKVPFLLTTGKISASDFEISRNRKHAAFDKDKLQFPLKLRRWKNGDSFYPIGMKGKKKLSDFFIDQKLNLYEKEDIWIMLSGDDIIWVINHRIDDRYKISETTKSVYFARLK